MTRLTILIVLIGAAGCTPKGPAPVTVSLDALIMPAPEDFQIERIELKSMIRDTVDPAVEGRAAVEREHLAQMGIRATGYFKYPRTTGGGFRVKVNIYDRPANLQRDWERRYPALVQEGSRPLDGVPGFLLPDKAAVMHDRAVLVEITSYRDAGDLEAFARHYIAHLQRVYPRR